jgi:hypothetical protein
MDMSKHFSRLIQHRVKRRKGNTKQLAAQLAPLEEQYDRRSHEVHSVSRSTAHQEHGAIVVDGDNLGLSEVIAEGRNTKGFLGIELVVLVILSVMLAFIAFIAWQISQMPAE